MSRWWSLSVVSLALAVCAAASANAQPRVVILEFEGPIAAQVRGAVVKVLLRRDVELVRQADVVAAAEASGENLGTESGMVEVARQMRLSAFVTGQVSKRGRRFETSIQVHDAASGAVVASFEQSARRAALARRVRRGVWQALGDVLHGTSVPPEPELEPEPEPEPEPELEPEPEPEPELEPEPEPEGKGPRMRALELLLGLRIAIRDFGYADPFPGLRDHTLDPTPELAGRVHWYPGTHFTDGFLANLGLELAMHYMLPVEATTLSGAAFRTNQHGYGVGLRLRIPIDRHELAIRAGYGAHSLELEDAEGGQDPGVPSVDYSFARLGFALRVWLAGLRFELSGAYLLPFAYGELADERWFPRVSGSGIEVELAASYPLSDAFLLRLDLGTARYFTSLDPQPDDAAVVGMGRVAGGSLDSHLYGSIGVELQL